MGERMRYAKHIQKKWYNGKEKKRLPPMNMYIYRSFLLTTSRIRMFFILNFVFTFSVYSWREEKKIANTLQFRRKTINHSENHSDWRYVNFWLFSMTTNHQNAFRSAKYCSFVLILRFPTIKGSAFWLSTTLGYNYGGTIKQSFRVGNVCTMVKAMDMIVIVIEHALRIVNLTNPLYGQRVSEKAREKTPFNIRQIRNKHCCYLIKNHAFSLEPIKGYLFGISCTCILF